VGGAERSNRAETRRTGDAEIDLFMHRVIIDTDPGLDDLFAILMALGSDRLEVLGITTVCGNATIENTTRNALRILALAGRANIPVYAGAAHPLGGPIAHESQVHGSDGLQGAPTPTPVSTPEPETAPDFLCRIFLERDPATTDLLCLGPLSNVALALRRQPALAQRIRRIVAMGGAFGTYSFDAPRCRVHSTGNMTANAEFNIYFDPEAAGVVFESGVPLVLVPLDLTYRTLLTPSHIACIRAVPRMGAVLAQTAEAFLRYCRKEWGADAAPLHDPNVVCWLEHPEIYRTVPGRIRVCVEAGDDFGRTTFEPAADAAHGVVFEVESEGFFEALINNLNALAARSPDAT
jgi:purine nucleosidase